MLICGGILVACSRQVREDEYIGQVRLESLLWALYLYYALLLLCFPLISGTAFLLVMMYALFTPLLLFLVRLHWVLYRSANAAAHAE
jgi:predicted ABC-type exoprotein transport system permease subunit